MLCDDGFFLIIVQKCPLSVFCQFITQSFDSREPHFQKLSEFFNIFLKAQVNSSRGQSPASIYNES